MNPTVIFIEIIIMLLVFGFCVFGLLYISPLTFISDYPPEIQAEYYRSQHKEVTKKKLTKLMKFRKLLAVVIFLFLFAWLLHLAGVKTFWQGVGLTWIYMLCVFAGRAICDCGWLSQQWADALDLVKRNWYEIHRNALCRVAVLLQII